MSRRVVPDDEPMWRALADPTRRAILDDLRDGPRTTGALAKNFPTTRFTVMEHLGVLASVGLITAERRGRERLNHLNPVPLQQAYERWVRPLAAAAAGTLLRLDEAVEAGRKSVSERTNVTAASPSLRGDGGIDTKFAMDVRASHRVGAGVAQTWRAVLGLPRWWPRRWRETERLVFEPWVGGRLGPAVDGNVFSEGAEGVLWGTVTALRPERELVVDGGMDMPGPVLGQWRMTLEPDGTDTTVTVAHRVIGAVDQDTRECYASGWQETLAHLAEHVAQQ